MPLTVTDPATVEAMAAAPHPTSVYGPDGRLLGQFMPAVPGMSYPEFGITDAEIQRRLDSADGWATGEEVMTRLRSLRDAG